jgi:long-chain fatty acid transport protein
MGTAFIAVADDPTAIMFNPAGLTQIDGTNVNLGITAVTLETDYESVSSLTETTDRQYFLPGYLYYSEPINDSLVFGIGLYSPFGIGGRKWSEDGLTRYFSTESFIATFTFNPTLAWQVNPSLSVGVGVDYLYSLNYASRMLDQSSFGAEDGYTELDANGSGWGYNLGLLYLVSSRMKIGLTYRSEIDVEYKGDVKIKNIAPELQSAFGGRSFSTKVRTKSVFPEIFGLGISYAPDNRWLFALDMEYLGWSSFATQRFDYDNEIPSGGLTDNSVNLDWDDSLQLKVGVEYKKTDNLFIRGGYAFIPTPVPGHTLNPSNPDADQHNFFIGLGFVDKNMTFDFFYNLGLNKKRKGNNYIAGAYDSQWHLLGASMNYKF